MEQIILISFVKCFPDEIDSYMYQTVGHDGIHMYSDALDLPLFRRKIEGNAIAQQKDYSPTEGDEVEDLYHLLINIKVSLHDINKWFYVLWYVDM